MSHAVSPLKDAHTPDITTQEGLCDVLMLGHIIELAEVFALNSVTHNDHKKNPTIVEEEQIARWRYRRFIGWIARTHVAVVNNSIVNIWYIFHRSMIEFASSLCAYKQACPDKTTEYPFTLEMLQKKISDHLKSDWPQLVPRFLQLLDSPTGLFTWTGPAFKIWRRDKLPPHFLVLELDDLKESPVFSLKSNAKDKMMVAIPDVEAGVIVPAKGSSSAAGEDDEDGSNMDLDSDVGESATHTADTGNSSSGRRGDVVAREDVESGLGEAVGRVGEVFRGKIRSRAESSGL
jgi:hypothetical protein